MPANGGTLVLLTVAALVLLLTLILVVKLHAFLALVIASMELGMPAEKAHLMVPDLFWPEFANILWKAVRRGRISPRTAEESIATPEKKGIATAPTAKTLRDAFAIATAFDRTVSDAVYVALALVFDAPLLTADERLANALAARFPVLWLGAYCGAG
ncbi:MAG: type II toxin-antitoxin system VapC family toxin [Acidobacteriia bacterium]|nr:type II toxin-antitoxin system VapC family toxin [Terriglobia bacterium]